MTTLLGTGDHSPRKKQVKTKKTIDLVFRDTDKKDALWQNVEAYFSEDSLDKLKELLGLRVSKVSSELNFTEMKLQAYESFVGELRKFPNSERFTIEWGTPEKQDREVFLLRESRVASPRLLSTLTTKLDQIKKLEEDLAGDR